jgi:hypothetical protein
MGSTLQVSFPAWQAMFNLRSGHVVFVVALQQVFCEYFGFPCQLFHQLLHIHLIILSSTLIDSILTAT